MRMRNTKESKSYSDMKVKSLSLVWLFVTPWTVAYQAPPSMGFFRQEHWSGLSFPSPGDLPNPGIEPRSPTLQVDSLPAEPQGKWYIDIIKVLGKIIPRGLYSWISWTEEPGRLQSMGSQRVRHDWATSLSLSLYSPWHPHSCSIIAFLLWLLNYCCCFRC